MKNNKWTRAAGGLLVLTLATSCFVGGTFAKYVTEDDGTDEARVAKWGVVIEGAGDATDMFNTTYSKDDATAGLPGSSGISVSSTTNVLAPGTTQKYDGIEVTGTPEVAVKVGTKADVDLGTNWNVPDSDGGTYFYCPLVFTIGDGEDKTVICGLHYSGENGGSNGGQTGLEGALEDAIEEQAVGNTTEFKLNEDDEFSYGFYNANTNLVECDIDTSFTWAWPFENNSTKDDNNHNDCGTYSVHSLDQNDTDDTALADLAFADGSFDENDAPTIEITLTTTVTQID